MAQPRASAQSARAERAERRAERAERGEGRPGRAEGRAGRAEGRPGRAIVRDFRAAGPGYEVEFDPRTAYDFVVSAFLDGDDVAELSSDDRKWLADAMQGLPEEVRELFPDVHKRLGPINLAAPVVENTGLKDAAAYVAFLETTPDAQLVRVLRSDLLDSPDLAPHAEAALGGDPKSIDQIEQIAGDYSGVALLRDPAGYLAKLRTGFRYWQVRYQPLEERVGDILRRDVADRAGDRATLPGPELVEQATGGIRLLADPSVRRVVLAPVYFGRPYNRIFAANGWRVFAYPVADSALGGTDRFRPPVSAVRLYRALGDETRLRILKLLGERDHYLTELAQELELSKPTIKHHLAQLRVAGLVTLTDEGSLTYYSLRRDRLEAAGKEVRDYLLK
jgi:DNA-binding transcriptional ArsR family regulator